MVKQSIFTRLYRDYRASVYAEHLSVSYANEMVSPDAGGEDLRLCWGASSSNFGDALSPLIVHLLSGRKLIGKNNDPSLASPKLLALGSILERAANHDVVWGAGARGESLSCSELDVHLVRGPLTRVWLQRQGVKCPDVYGDPAVLMPWIYQPEVNKDFDVGVIRHYADQSVDQPSTLKVNHIDVRDDPLRVIEELCRCKTVLSSSLHGLVIAEAYGIPSCWLRPSNPLWSHPEPMLKYEDYFLGSGRSPIAFEFDKALDIEKAVAFASQVEKPNFKAYDLLMSFPYLRRGIKRLDDLEQFRIVEASVHVPVAGFAGYVLGRIVKKWSGS